MFSCFGKKSSSLEDISPKRISTRSERGLRRVTTKKKESIIENRQVSTSQSVVTSSTTHSSSELRRNVSITSSIPRSSLTRRDTVVFRKPIKVSANLSPQEPTYSNNFRVRNPSSISLPQPGTTNNNVNKYKVAKTNKYYDNVRGDPLPVYKTHSKNRGHVLLINNVKFYRQELHRRGAQKDEKDLNDVLKQIGFQVENHHDVKKSDIKKILKNFTSQKKLEKGDICLVVVMSHGTNNDIPGGYTEILCVDGERISTENIIDYFNESECQFLKSKPKIFIFQCCRNAPERDGLLLSKKPQDKSNTLIAYSTIPGFASNRCVENGTWYIQTICQVFSKHAHEYHIEELLRFVDKEMKSKHSHIIQVSCFENRGFSRCYLHPH